LNALCLIEVDLSGLNTPEHDPLHVDLLPLFVGGGSQHSPYGRPGRRGEHVRAFPSAIRLVLGSHAQPCSGRRELLRVLRRGEFLNWGTPGAQASVTTKDELRGWIRALDWVLGRT